MKKVFAVFTMLLIAVAVSAQDFVSYNGSGKVILNDGTVYEGTVEYSLTSPGSVSIKVGDGKWEKYKAKEVKEFYLDLKHYSVLKPKGEISVGSDLAFGYIINAEDARIRIYKNETQSPVMTGGVAPVETTYYAALPGVEGEVYPLAGMQLNPSAKLSKYFEDCPALAEKIAKKEKGFSYGMITTDEIRLAMIEKYNAEYASCAK